MEKQRNARESIRAIGNEVRLNEALGQNFLVDEGVIGDILDQVVRGGRVIEVGSGVGHVTERLAKVARDVVGFEIDRRFISYLKSVEQRNDNVSFVVGNVLDERLDRYLSGDREDISQIVGNLPFHITEPFLHQIVDLPIDGAVLMLGKKMAEDIRRSFRSPFYGKSSLLAQSFFNIFSVCKVSRDSFAPVPGTDAEVLEFVPKTKEEIRRNPVNFVFSYLFMREDDHGPAINDLKQAIVEADKISDMGTLTKTEWHQRRRLRVRQELSDLKLLYNNTGEAGNFSLDAGSRKERVGSQHEALRVIDSMGVSKRVLSKPFSSFSNQNIRDLVRGVSLYYGSKDF